jgi:hypothetical protein
MFTRTLAAGSRWNGIRWIKGYRAKAVWRNQPGGWTKKTLCPILPVFNRGQKKKVNDQ